MPLMRRYDLGGTAGAACERSTKLTPKQSGVSATRKSNDIKMRQKKPGPAPNRAGSQVVGALAVKANC